MGKQSSDEISALAGRILRFRPIIAESVSARMYQELLDDAQRLAGSVLAQDETRGNRFTRALRKLVKS